MNFQYKVFENTADFRARAAAFAQQRASELKASASTLRSAGREFGKVAGRHLSRFLQQNSSLAREAGQEVSDIARVTLSQLAEQLGQRRGARKTSAAKASPARKPSAARKRPVAATRARRAAKTV